MKKISRNWTQEEDQMLKNAMFSSGGLKRLKWQEVAEMMHSKNPRCQKTGKQCRQRWHNQLAPSLNNSGEWTPSENATLFHYHAILGNKWARIAEHLDGRTDNCVKNHFYSTLRRGMRKVNNYIHEIRKKKNPIKQFKPEVLTKILIVADNDPQQKLNVKNNAYELSKNIKNILIEVSLKQDDDANTTAEENLVKLISEFNKNCKKRKGKKKVASGTKLKSSSAEEDINEDDSCESEQENEKSNLHYQKQKLVKFTPKQIVLNIEVEAHSEEIAPLLVYEKAIKQKKNTVLKKNSLSSCESHEGNAFNIVNPNELGDFFRNSGHQSGRLVLPMDQTCLSELLAESEVNGKKPDFGGFNFSIVSEGGKNELLTGLQGDKGCIPGSDIMKKSYEFGENNIGFEFIKSRIVDNSSPGLFGIDSRISNPFSNAMGGSQFQVNYYGSFAGSDSREKSFRISKQEQQNK